MDNADTGINFGDVNYEAIALEKSSWNPCMFWVEPQQFWNINSTTDDSNSYSITVSSMEACKYINLRNKSTKTIKLCGIVLLHNISMYDEVTMSLDLYYSDGTYLWDQAIYFTSKNDKHSCIVISGTKIINHLLISIGSKNEPKYSWASFTDINLFILPNALGSIEVSKEEQLCMANKNCVFSSSFPTKFSRHTEQPMFYKSTHTPVFLLFCVSNSIS